MVPHENWKKLNKLLLWTTRDSYWCQKYYGFIFTLFELAVDFLTLYKAPRALSQSDLQRVLGTSTKTRVAVNGYSKPMLE